MTMRTLTQKSFTKVVLAVGATFVLLGHAYANDTTSETTQLSACSKSGSSVGANISSGCSISNGEIQWVSIDSGSGQQLEVTQSGNLTTSGNQIIFVKNPASNWTIKNSGEIKNSGTSGSGTGIYIVGAGTTVENSGSISSTKNGSAAIWVASSGDTTLKNSDSGAISGSLGLYVTGTGSVTLTNASGASISGTDRGIKVQSSTIKITNSDSGSTISGGKYGIEINGGSGHSIENKSGATISSSGAIGIAGGVVVESIKNESGASITGTAQGLYVGRNNSGAGVISTVTNAGAITGTGNGSNAIYVIGEVSTLKNTGTIQTSGSNSDAVYISGAGKIGTFSVASGATVSGTKNGFNLVKYSGSDDSIGLLEVTGTGAIIGGNGAGVSSSNKIGEIVVGNHSATPLRFNGLTALGDEEDNDESNPSETTVAKIQGSSYGILSNGTIGTITLSGAALVTGDIGIANTVSGTLNGRIDTIRIDGASAKVSGATTGLQNAGTIGSLTLTQSGAIVGGTTGIVNTGEIGTIHVGQGASITGSTYGISNTGTIHGLWIEDQGQVGAIYNTGTISVAHTNEDAKTLNPLSYSPDDERLNDHCRQAAICISGTGTIGSITNLVTASGDTSSAGLIDGDIHVQSHGNAVTLTNGQGARIVGSITGASGAIGAITNAGTITGDIVIEGTAGQKITLANSTIDGIEGTITFNGQASAKADKSILEITDWNTKIISGTDDTGAPAPQLPKVYIEGSGGQVVVKSVTISSVDGSVAKGSVDLNHTFFYETQDGESTPSAITVESAHMSDALSAAGWSGYFDKEKGLFQTDFSTERSAGGIMGQTLAGQLARRDFFLDSVVTQASADALYHRVNAGNNGIVFAKPYVSFDSFDAGLYQFSGDTVGAIVGATGLLNHHVVTGFLGYEKSTLDSRYLNARMSLESSSLYGGVSVARVIRTYNQLDTFGRVTAKASYTRTTIDRDLNAELSTGSTHTVSYGADAQLGINYRFSDTSRIVPMAGIGFSAGSTQDYTMENSISLRDSYQPGHAFLPYGVASITWHHVWMDYLRTYLTAGVRYNFQTELKSTANFNGATVSGSYDLVKMYEYLAFSINMKLTKHSEFSYGYTGVFDDQGQSHNVIAQYKYLF